MSKMRTKECSPLPVSRQCQYQVQSINQPIMRALLLFAFLFCCLAAVEANKKPCTVTKYKTLPPKTKTVTKTWLAPTVTSISTILDTVTTVETSTVHDTAITTVSTSTTDSSTVYDLPPVTTTATTLAAKATPPVFKRVSPSKLNPGRKLHRRDSLLHKNRKCKVVTRFVRRTRTVTQTIHVPRSTLQTTTTSTTHVPTTTATTTTDWTTTTDVSVIHPNHNFKGCNPTNFVLDGEARIERSTEVYLQQSPSTNTECCEACYSKGNTCTIWSYYDGSCYIGELSNPRKCLVKPYAKVNITTVNFYPFDVYQGYGPCAVVYSL